MKISLSFILIYFSYFKFITSDNCFKSLCIPSGYDKTIKPDYIPEEYYYDNYYDTERLNQSKKSVEIHKWIWTVSKCLAGKGKPY